MFIKAEIWTVGRTENGLAALLRLPTSSRCVPVYIEHDEAYSILASLSGTEEKPPRFPGLFSAFSAAVGIKPESVEILKTGSPGNFRAVIHFAGEATRFSLDSRAPIALSLAVQCGIPIFLENAIAEEDSIGINLSENEMPFAMQLSRLKNELNKRVDEEDYEQAARLRDRIKVVEERMRSEKK